MRPGVAFRTFSSSGVTPSGEDGILQFAPTHVKPLRHKGLLQTE
jgi:hypothetical protein